MSRSHKLVRTTVALMWMIAIIALPLGAGAQPSAKAVTVRAAYVPVATWLPAWVAKDKGIFDKHGLDVSLAPIQNLSLIPGTLGRQFDIAPSTAPDLIKAAVAGLDVVAVAGEAIEHSANSSMQVMVRPDSGISGPKNLGGKVIATPSVGAVIHLSLLHWLKGNGVDPESIRSVEVPFPNMMDQLKARRVDAVEALQPFVGQMQGAGFVSIGSPMLYVGDPVLFPFWIAQSAWAHANLPVIGRWIAALTDAKVFIEQNDAEARAIMVKYTGLPAPVAQKIPLPTYQFSIRPEQLDVWIKTMRGLGQLQAPVDSSRLVVTPK